MVEMVCLVLRISWRLRRALLVTLPQFLLVVCLEVVFVPGSGTAFIGLLLGRHLIIGLLWPLRLLMDGQILACRAGHFLVFQLGLLQLLVLIRPVELISRQH